MAKISIDEKLEQLEDLVLDGTNEDDLALVKKSLGAKHSRLVTKATKLCADHHLYQFCPELKQAFHYFLGKPDKDKGCFAKKAIVKTLYELDQLDTDFYTLAIDTRQMEPVWCGSVDTAVEVRCWAAFGLTLSANSRIILLLLELLHDPEPQARLGAVKAIANTNPTHAEILLREKILDGDEDTYIIGECFHQLIAIEPESSLDFIKRYLDHEQEEWIEYAALAIAESTDPKAFDILKGSINECFDSLKKAHLIKAMAIHRSKHSTPYLLERLESAGKQEAKIIVEALSVYKSNDKLKKIMKETVAACHGEEIVTHFTEFWDQ